jgi:hypothetical protein
VSFCLLCIHKSSGASLIAAVIFQQVDPISHGRINNAERHIGRAICAQCVNMDLLAFANDKRNDGTG